MGESAASSFAQTDVGRQRDHNEDSFLVDRKLRLFVVCDGMGGHSAGEVASSVAVKTLSDEVRKAQDLLADYVEGKTGADKVSKRDILNMLEFAVNCASRKIHAEASLDAKKRGMGTTLVALLVVGQQAFIVHVGDSRVYLLRNGNLEQLTEDHNVYNEFIKKKKLKLDVAQLAPKSAITRAVGVYEHCEPDTLVIDVAPGDRFLLCTDGLSGYFEAPEGSLEELAAKLATRDADHIVGDLIKTANERGGKDNITAVVVAIGDPEDHDAQLVSQLEAQREALAATPLFSGLNGREIRRVLQVTDVVHFGAGEAVVEEGELGNQLFVVLNGLIEVVRNGNVIASLKPGEHFGEMALIRNQPRSATARAACPTELMVIRRKDFFEILRTEQELAVKLLWAFTGVLANRLEETTRDLGRAREELAFDVTCELFFEEDDQERITLELPAVRAAVASRPPPAPPGNGLSS